MIKAFLYRRITVLYNGYSYSYSAELQKERRKEKEKKKEKLVERKVHTGEKILGSECRNKRNKTNKPTALLASPSHF